MAEERLHKILARSGVASLRASEALIAAGRVSVNGVTVIRPGAHADAARDLIAVDGVPIEQRKELAYLALNKPSGVVTSSKDDRGRPDVVSLLRDGSPRVHPVGRLDVDSEGLLLLTNDGELTHRLTHPRFQVEKEYLAMADRRLPRLALHRAVRGVDEGGERLRMKSVRLAGESKEPPGYRYVCVLTEGKKREVRRLFFALGARVTSLTRVREGTVILGDLPSGAVRPLEEAEVASLRRLVGLAPEDESHVPVRKAPGSTRRVGPRPARARK
jgi:23S rRNA pseudouridine2605 synthase